MVHENEIAMLLFGFGILVFTSINQKKLRSIPSWKYFITGFYVLLAGWVFTIVEGFFWNNFFNILEHLSYAVSSVILAAWCFKSFSSKAGLNK